MRLMGRFGGMMLLGIVMLMRRRPQCEEQQRQEGKDERLDEADEDFQEVERNRGETRTNERHHQQQHISGKDIAKKTEAEREHAQQFQEELNQRLGLAEADVTSARELSAEERRRLETQIKSVTGKSVTARYATDAGLLGGALVRVGSTVYDGSVRGQLERLKEQLIAG